MVTKKTREDILKNISSENLVLWPDGSERPIDKNCDPDSLDDISDESLVKYIKSEEMSLGVKEAPPSIKAMQKLELAGYEPSSDIGNLRFYPKGNLVLRLLNDWVDEIALDRLEALQVLTPMIYRADDKQIGKQVESFHERHYKVSSSDDKHHFTLRFAADPGEFKMIEDASISYRSLPFRIYEYSNSFRYELSGEVVGLRRLRSFHMPDVHSFVSDVDSGWEEYQNLFKHYTDLANGTGIEYAIVFRAVENFYNENKEKFKDMLKYADKPAFIEKLSDMKHYWAVKHEFQGIDSVDGNLQLSTVQLDVKSSENFNLTYFDKEGKKKPLYIVHSSIGSIERWMYALLENSLKDNNPSLPYWLSPTQVRVIPVNDDHVQDAQNLGQRIEKSNVRVDYDNRSASISKKIRNAEKDWVPYVLVYGDKERDSGILSVRDREVGSVNEYSISDLIGKLKEKQGDMPYRRLPVKRKLSERLIFS